MRPTKANAVSELGGRVVVYLPYGVFSTSVGGVDDFPTLTMFSDLKCLWYGHLR